MRENDYPQKMQTTVEGEIGNELSKLELNIQNCVSLVERIEGRLYLILAEPKPRANEKRNDELVKSKLGGRLKVFSYQLDELNSLLSDIEQRIQL